jgi:hypothetical protein
LGSPLRDTRRFCRLFFHDCTGSQIVVSPRSETISWVEERTERVCWQFLLTAMRGGYTKANACTPPLFFGIVSPAHARGHPVTGA